jgi:hypothetical protein
MAAEIQITWDGTVPGLAEKRLSIGEFGESLRLLLVALRRIAHEMVINAMEGEASQRGRLVTAAKNLDIEITSIKANSAGFNGLVTLHSPPPQIDMFMPLQQRAATALLDDIDRESKGYPVNGAVRTYLRSLPPGTTRQVYEVYEDGKSLKRVDIGEIRLTELPPDLPIIRSFEGEVAGVGFEPGKSEVKVKTEATLVAVTARPDDVEKALDLRKEKIRTLSVHDGRRARLISLKRASAARFEFDPESATKKIFERWDNVLRQLAK